MALSRNVTLRVRQLAMFQPSNALLVWRAESVQIPQNMVNGMSGFRSVGPLMGGASFNLQLPKSASGLYIVVREWRGAKQTYLRIDNLFRPETMWSFGVNQETARPHPGRHRFQILPDVWNRFDVRWTNNSFQVSLNGVGVSNKAAASERRQPGTGCASFVRGMHLGFWQAPPTRAIASYASTAILHSSECGSALLHM